MVVDVQLFEGKNLDTVSQVETLASYGASIIENYAAYTSGVTGVEPFLDEAIKSSPENNPPADAPKGSFIQVCDQETQTFYDAIWTNLKK